MMALEITTTTLDRTVKTHQSPRRRWSLYGSKEATLNATKLTPTHASPASKPLETEKEKHKRSRSRSVDMTPLQSNLKKAPAALSAKLTQCVEALGLREALHRYQHNDCNHSDDHGAAPAKNSKGKHVRFPSTKNALTQIYERPQTTDVEKQAYHYSRQELTDMVLDARESLVRETHFYTQPEGTILEQGYLTFPNELHFFHHKRYYCLLKPRGELVCYASPAHAAKNIHVKCHFSIIKVQECSTMPMQAKIAALGAHLPSTLSLLFFVTKADGERVLLSAESRSIKKNWAHTLARITQVHESLPRCTQPSTASTSSSSCSDDDETPQSSPLEKTETATCDKAAGGASDDDDNNNEVP